MTTVYTTTSIPRNINPLSSSQSPENRSSNLERIASDGATLGNELSSRIISLENFEDYVRPQTEGSQSNVANIRLNSPRSLQVCMEHGVDPEELLPIDLAVMERNVVVPTRRNAFGKEIHITLTPAERRAIALRRYHELEERRSTTLIMLKRARGHLISRSVAGSPPQSPSSVDRRRSPESPSRAYPNMRHSQGQGEGAVPDSIDSMQAAPTPEQATASDPQRTTPVSSSRPYSVRTQNSPAITTRAVSARRKAELVKQQLLWEREVYERDRETRQIHAEERHRQAKERAQLLQQVQQEQFIKDQIAKEKTYTQRLRRLQFSKALKQEQRRLRHDRVREQSERLKRIQEYHEMQKTEELLRAAVEQQLDPETARLQKEIHRYRIQAAKQLYADPRYRNEKLKSSRTPRDSF